MQVHLFPCNMLVMKYFIKIYKMFTQVRLLLVLGLVVSIIVVTYNPVLYNYFVFNNDFKVVENQTVDNFAKVRESLKSQVRISEIYPNCGLKYICPEDSFPVHIYTGQDKDDKPKLCVQGKYLKGGGRGLNIAVIENKYLQLIAVQNFDLYKQNSSSLESWLLNSLQEGDIIIAFTFDEASRELSWKAKAILYDLGSGKIQDLHFRSQWYMISQKGIKGFTPLENLTHSLSEQRWGEAIDERRCVPRKIEPIPVSPDPVPRRNPSREILCSETPELMCDQFCNVLAKHEPYSPSLLTNRSLIGNLIFSTPVIVVAKTLSSLALTLESLIYQPGVHSGSVFVIYHESQTKVPQLCQIFGFRSLPFNSTHDTSNGRMNFGLKYIHEAYPKKKYAIFIEEGLILSPDFLFYHAQMIPILEKDSSILGVSAWNPYGYKEVSGNYSWAYRVEDFPGLGFLIRMDVFVNSIMDNLRNCCQRKAYLGWPAVLQEYKDAHIIIPDVSRVLKRPRDLYSSGISDDEFKTFTLPRVTSVKQNAYIERPYDLTEDRYFSHMAGLVQSSITFHLTNEDLKLCEAGNNIAIKIMLTELKNKIFSVYYQEESCTSYDKLKSYLKCFDIYVLQDFNPQNMYKKITRFTVNKNIVLLIESTSKFAKNKFRTN